MHFPHVGATEIGELIFLIVQGIVGYISVRAHKRIDRIRNRVTANTNEIRKIQASCTFPACGHKCEDWLIQQEVSGD